MRDFEVVDIEEEDHRFLVEIEFLDDRKRKQFGFPKGNGWELEIEGEPKFLRHIRRKIAEIEEAKSISVDDVKQKIKNCKVRYSADNKEGVLDMPKKGN